MYTHLENNGVIITVHVESKNVRSDCWKKDPIKRLNPNKVSKTRGYDRRAQLLAYAHKLRHANAQQLPLPTFNSSKPKLNKWRWGVPMEKIRRLMMRFDGKHRYESIVVDDYGDDEGSCKNERVKKNGSKPTKRRYSHFCKKLRCLLKKISGAWKCKLDLFGKGA